MITAEAPASTANLGPGFDAAGAALDLWNVAEIAEGAFEVELAGEGADELARDRTHLSVRAFGVFADAARFRFRFTNRIPLERGLGSSAAAIGLGLVAGARAAGRSPSADELLAAAAAFEGHVDNLAAVVRGGVCVAWRENDAPRAHRIADGLPAAAVAVVPTTRTSTAASRTALPDHVTHEDAAANAGAAMLLGAAIAAGDAALLRHAFADRLHESYRAESAPLLGRVRALAPPGTIGVTLSGSGPTVIAWSEKVRAAAVAEELRAALGDDVQVSVLAVSARGANAA
ncbi:MAG TPA: homoserine kinase [Gaiellaceae bacterium]